MADKDPIVISDSDSDTLSESERPVIAPPKASIVKKQPSESQAGAKTALNGSPSSTLPEGSTDETQAMAGPSTAGLLGLLPDRRQLELERKERARKRRREQNLPSSSSDDETQVGVKRSKGTNVSSAAPLSRSSASLLVQRDALPSNTASTAGDASSSRLPQGAYSTNTKSYSTATDAITPASRFWHGTVKHSYNQYASSGLSGVSISQMLLPATPSNAKSLQLAVLATYDLRIDWLYSLFPRGLPVTLVLPPPKEDYRFDKDVARPGLHPSHIFGGNFARCPGWQVCVPSKPKGGWLTQHMKFLVLVHETFLRVAILSGNLNGIDWERIENTAYIQDFPLLDEAKLADMGRSSSGSSGSNKNDFKSQLVRVLRSLSMPSSHPVYAALEKYDFSLATRARIVASWPEASSLADWDRIETQGLGRLGKVVRDLGIQAPVEIECQGSSLANHDIKWIEHFHVLASGVNPRGLLPFKGKPNEVHPEYARALGAKRGLPPVKICFPSHRYVEERTVEGPLGALSFFGKAETFAASPIKSLYYSPQSRRGDVMIHAKSILALTAEGKIVVDKAFVDASDEYISGRATQPSLTNEKWSGPKEGEKPIGWTYLGSSNFTRAAHGNISGTAAKPTMSSLNWELGVVLPIYASEVEALGVQAESLRPVVYHRPLQAYANEDAPWDNASARALV